VAERPVVTFDRDLRRRRAAVLFRAVLAVPALVLLAGFSIVVAGLAVVAWVFGLLTARVPARVHRVLRVYVRYAARVAAWLTLTARRYPRVRGVAPPLVELERARHSRGSVLVRPLLALPSVVLAGAFGSVLLAAAVASWFVALALGRTTEGLRELGAFCIRYQAEVLAFLVLATPRMPRLDPASRARR
jgi:hypothetical protein